MSTHGRNVGLAAGALLASSGTLICCVLPAVMVSLGAGAAMAGLVSEFPQLVWLSEHKALVFGIAALLLAASGIMIWRARNSCPVEPEARRACTALRRVSLGLYGISLAAFAAGVTFAFLLPALAG